LAVPNELPDQFKVNVHRVFGFVVGCGFGFWVSFDVFSHPSAKVSAKVVIPFILACGVLIGWLAGRGLDRFWNDWFSDR
jgi:hypothetical protein